MKRPAAPLRRLAGASSSSRLPRRTVRLRLTALYGCLFLLSGAGLLVITNLLVAHQSTRTAFYISRGNGPAQTHIEGVIGDFSAPVGIPPVAILMQKRAARAARAGNRSGSPDSRGGSLDLSASGSAAIASGPDAIALPGSIPAAAGPPAAIKVLTAPTPEQLRTQARQLTTLAGKQRSTEQSHLLATSAIALGIMAVISLALGWLIGGRALRPLDEAFEAQRRFVANASHELRTPLAMMRTSLDVAVAKPGPSSPQLQALERKLREGLDQADRLLEGFLTLARAQRGAPLQQGSVSLSDLLRAAVADHARTAAERGIEVRASFADDARVTGSETLLRRMIDNLIDNATRHNEPGGWARVTAERTDAGHSRLRGGVRGGAGQRTGKAVRVVVENGGPLLRPEEIADLAQPFRRLGTERTGSQDGHGLGLSIVAAIAAAHEGTLELHARAEGGLRVAVELPAGAATPAPAAAAPADAGLSAGAPS